MKHRNESQSARLLGILAIWTRLEAVERGGQRVRFHYDGTGMLVAKEFPDGSLEKWVWDGIALLARGDERYINVNSQFGHLA